MASNDMGIPLDELECKKKYKTIIIPMVGVAIPKYMVILQKTEKTITFLRSVEIDDYRRDWELFNRKKIFYTRDGRPYIKIHNDDRVTYDGFFLDNWWLYE